MATLAETDAWIGADTGDPASPIFCPSFTSSPPQRWLTGCADVQRHGMTTCFGGSSPSLQPVGGAFLSLGMDAAEELE
jgi:hypothetical protein